jgi:hypothetical protein
MPWQVLAEPDQRIIVGVEGVSSTTCSVVGANDEPRVKTALSMFVSYGYFGDVSQQHPAGECSGRKVEQGMTCMLPGLNLKPTCSRLRRSGDHSPVENVGVELCLKTKECLAAGQLNE